MATIDKNTVFPSTFDEVEKRVEFDSTASTSSLFQQREQPNISAPIQADISTSLELTFEEEIESGVTQEFSNSDSHPFDFLSDTEEDLLDWDTAIMPAPPRPSGTIRVKLKYLGRSKPLPIENFEEE